MSTEKAPVAAASSDGAEIATNAVINNPFSYKNLSVLVTNESERARVLEILTACDTKKLLQNDAQAREEAFYALQEAVPRLGFDDTEGHATEAVIDTYLKDVRHAQTLARIAAESAKPEAAAAQDAEIIPQAAVQRAEELLSTGRALEFVADVIGRVHYGDRDLVKLLWLSAAAIRQPDRIHWLLVGTPGSGKSDLARKILAVLPAEHKVKLDDASPKSFYYAEKAGVSLSQRVICIDDVRPDTGTVAILKALASDGREALQHWTVDDKRQFQQMQIPEDVLVIATTIQSLTDQQGQLLRRYQIVNPDESKEALDGVADMIKRAARLPFEVTDPEFEADVQTAKAVYKILISQDLRVAIPFDFEYTLERHADKTALKAFSALVKAHALVNFMNRVRVGPVILADRADLEAAGNLWRSTKALKIDETAERVLNCLPRREPVFDEEIEKGNESEDSKKDKSLLDAEVEKGNESEDSKKDKSSEEQKTGLYRASNIAKTLSLAPRTVRDKLFNLYEVGLIDRKKTGLRGTPWACWRVDGEANAKNVHVNEETYEREVMDTVRRLTDMYRGNAEALFIAFENRRREGLGLSQGLISETDGETTVPPGNAENAEDIPSGQPEPFTAPPKTTPSLDEQRPEDGVAIITAEKEIYDESEHTGPVPVEYIPMGKKEALRE